MSKTQIATGGIADSAVTSAKASGLGVTMVDQWRLTANKDFSDGEQTITSDLERIDTSPQGVLGTGMTESSGVFTFPSTGIYQIIYTMSYQSQTGSYTGAIIRGSTDGFSSSDVILARAFDRIQGGGDTDGGTFNITTLYDVTNTSNNKVKFGFQGANTSADLEYSSSLNLTTMTFIRFGDT